MRSVCLHTSAYVRYEEERRGHGLPGKGVVLCNFNHLHKTSRAQWAVWARILRGVRSRMLTYAHVCSRMLTYAHGCSRMLTDAHGCSSMLVYAHVCSRMLTYAHGCSRMLTYSHVCSSMLTGKATSATLNAACVCGRMLTRVLTYADVC